MADRELRDESGRPLELAQPATAGGARRIVPRTAKPRPPAPMPQPLTAEQPPRPVTAAPPQVRRAAAPEPFATDYLGRAVPMVADLSTQAELDAAVATLNTALGTRADAAALSALLSGAPAALDTFAEVAGVLNGRLSDAALRAAYVRQGATLTNPDALKKWWIALGRRQSNLVNVCVSGNSKREGTGATNYADRFPLALQERLRRTFQPTGVTGATVPNVHLAGMSPLPANLPYTIGGTATGSQYGLGGRGFKAVSGTTITIPFTGTRAKVRYYKANAAGVLNIVLDGGAPVTVDSFVSGAASFGVWDTGALAAGSHTLVITRDATTQAGRDVFLGDVEIFNGDEAKGIRVYDAARHGVTANGLYTSQTGWRDEFTAIGNWSLLVLGLGENDSALTAAQYKTEVQGVIAWFRTYGFASSVLLVHDAQPGNIADAALWASFGQAEKDIAAADPDVAALDLSTIIPAYTAANPLGVYSDDRHNTSGGQGWEADLVASVLLPR